MKFLGLLFIDKGEFIVKSLKIFAIKQYAITRIIVISSVGRCMPYELVVLLSKECRDTIMACRWNIGVYSHRM